MKTLKSSRLHIGIFGKTNVGKSSLLNAITNQDTAIVSDIAGTTTDVVEKSMELFPVGPVTFLDTAGIDDVSSLGNERIQKTLKVINRTDIAVVVIDFNGINHFEIDLFKKFSELNIPILVVVNKTDIMDLPETKLDEILTYTPNIISISTKTTQNITELFVEKLVKILPDEFVNTPPILGDIVSPRDIVVLVTPIDKEAPKGRLILPQVQTIRDLLDNKCISVITDVENLELTLSSLNTPPRLIVTDSQAFKQVNEIIPPSALLTSFSILFAKLKGDLDAFIDGTSVIDKLKPDDKILILESCTHHQIEDDIAKVKIPKLLEKKLGFSPIFEFYSGHDFPDISSYKLVIHCGACMTNRREILSRIMTAKKLNVPMTNFGVIISYCLGILPKATEVFKFVK